MRFLLLITLLFLPNFASAEKKPDEKDFFAEIFETEKDTKYFLRSQGIEPPKLNWAQISSMCSNLQKFENKIQNKCKYDNAKLLNSFNEEKKFCKKFVEAAYSFNRLSENEARNYLMVDAGGNRSNITLIETGRTIGAIQDIQKSEMLKCMKNHGWVNPDNWQAGRM